ncbi:MAG: aminopeptidase P family protein [Oscillospiraceae bacterium]|nr:aminopeptidase P family protein [Oscillospiraceae bacterium]
MKKRIARLRDKMRELSLDAYLVTSYENYRYFSGFCGSNCTLIIGGDTCFALTDGRYDIQIKEQTDGFETVIISRPMHEHIAEILSENFFLRVGYETHKMTDFELRNLKAASGDTEYVPCDDFGEEIRSIKDKGEIDAIRRAVRCSDDAFAAFVKTVSRGMTEREAAARLEYEMALRGSRAAAFDTIAASGIRSAMPHAEPSASPIEDNCLMTFDFGATVNGYMSDITRTVHIGTPSKQLCELWELVFDVQQKCIARIQCGMRASELDEYQCSLFAASGMEKYIMHSLGHGVGLAIHEAPTVSRRSHATLSENMIITVEPGLYIKDVGGCRIEDTVLITKNGGVALTQSPHRINITL